MFSAAARLRSPVLARQFSMSTARRSARPVSLLSPKELHDLVVQQDHGKTAPPSTVVLDASWHMPAAKRLPFQEYRKKRIEGAAFWDVSVSCPFNSSSMSSCVPSKEAHQLLGGRASLTLRIGRGNRDQIASTSDVGVPRQSAASHLNDDSV